MSDANPIFNAAYPVERKDITDWTDSYFTNTRLCVDKDGESIVTYAVFIRTPSMFAPFIAVEWLKESAHRANISILIESIYQPGDIVPSGYPQLYITGPLSFLVECETAFLQKFGATSVAAFNAYQCCRELIDTPFIAMGARHCAGLEMQEMMDYAASLGGITAAREHGAKGFIAGTSDATAHFFGRDKGVGTMPHALVGYYGSTLKAAQRFRDIHPDKNFTVLNDFFGREISDSIEVAKAFPTEAANGTLSFRLDTNGARYLEGLSHSKSIDVIRANAPQMMNENWSESQLKTLYGMGVSVAAVWHFRNEMTKAGFPNVGIVGSSGFGVEKCRIMALAKAPLTTIGTGSYIPTNFQETYTTADIIKYDGEFRIKTGREYLIDHYKKEDKKQPL